MHIGRDIHRLRLALGVDAVAGIELHELQFVVGARAEQLVEVVEHLGHEVPRRSGVEAEAILLPRAGAAAERRLLFEQHHVVTFAGEQRR